MARVLHRRINLAPFAADAPGTVPPESTFAYGDAAGGVTRITPRKGAVLVVGQLMSGMGDAATKVAPGTFTWSYALDAHSRQFGIDLVIEAGAETAAVPSEGLRIEAELGQDTLHWVRPTEVASNPGGALWIYIDTNVEAAGIT